MTELEYASKLLGVPEGGVPEGGVMMVYFTDVDLKQKVQFAVLGSPAASSLLGFMEIVKANLLDYASETEAPE